MDIHPYTHDTGASYGSICAQNAWSTGCDGKDILPDVCSACRESPAHSGTEDRAEDRYSFKRDHSYNSIFVYLDNTIYDSDLISFLSCLCT